MGNKTKYKGIGKHPTNKKRIAGKKSCMKVLPPETPSKVSLEQRPSCNPGPSSQNIYETRGDGDQATVQDHNLDNRNLDNSDSAKVITIDVHELNMHHTENVDGCENIQIESDPVKDSGIELSGRRIVNFQHILSELIKFAAHNKNFGCSLENLICERETRIGLISKFIFKCNYCSYRQTVRSESKESNVLDINRSIIAGIMSIGGGFSALDQIMSSVDIPCMSQRFYQKLHSELTDKWQETAEESMAEAAAEEREAALEEGRVDENGTPIIDVIADGCWAKRSYRSNYSSLSGAAAIIGKRFGKVLFLAVRNKYCSICEHCKKTNKNIDHKCYKNYDGSSTSMESDILVEGFKTSISMYNLIYGRLVSDGDSSTYCKILQAQPYPHTTVEKIECINHLLRNFCNKMRALNTDTRFPIKLRKMITQQRIMSMRRNIKKVIRHYQNLPTSDTVKINNLHFDINNLLNHIFHSHNDCKDFYCSENKSGNQEELINDLRANGLWVRLTVIVSSLAAHARSLLHNTHSNIVESFNAIIAKFIGGKRVNYTSRGSYSARAFAAVLAQNTKIPLYRLQKAILNKSPRSKIKEIEEKKRKRFISKNKYIRAKKRIVFAEKKSQNDYGLHSEQPDMEKEALERNKTILLENLRKNSVIREQIQKDTILQREDSKWLELRRKMLTASSFAAVISRKETTKCAPLVQRLLSPKNLSGITSISHGIKYEKTALKQLETQEKVKITPCGLFIDKEYPFLGATPDGLIESKNMIVEIKCPITAFKLGLDEAIKKKKLKFWSVSNGERKINKNHPWFYQIQGQLHVTEKNTCLFAVWYGEDKPLATEYIQRDDSFWHNKMVKKLVKFYMECLLPEIVDSRIKRGLPVREPEYIQKAIEKKEKRERSGDDHPTHQQEEQEYREDQEMEILQYREDQEIEIMQYREDQEIEIMHLGGLEEDFADNKKVRVVDFKEF